MSIRELDAIFYVATPPTVEFRDGLFHISYRIGRRATFEVVMPAKAFLKARMLGSEVIAQWRLDDLPDGKTVKRMQPR